MVAVIFIIIFALVTMIGVIAILIQRGDEKLGGIVATILGLIAIAVTFVLGAIALIPNGHVGVLVRFGKVTGVTLQSGLNMKPLIDSCVVMSIQTQLFQDNATAASKDLQDVEATIAINYRLAPEEAKTVYRTIGLNYIHVIASPLVQETVKEVTAKYNAEDMILRRAEIKSDISNLLVERLAKRGIISESVSIVNFEFSSEFTKAIEAKVVAIQKVLEAENKLKQIEVEARQAEQVAKGQAAAAVAFAEGQAQANKVLRSSLTPELIQYMFIQSIKNTDKVIAVPSGVTIALPLP